MLSLLHYLPYMLVTCFIVLIVIAFTGERPRTDYRRLPRQRHYQWNDKSAHRD